MGARRVHEIGASRLVLDSGSVLDGNAEVVVSSDDHMLTMSGGVSAAIRDAAGSALVLDAAKAVPAQVGQVVVTTAGTLQARYVFHVITIGPDHWQAPPQDAETTTLVREATRSCLRLAQVLGVGSIVFPALGTGAAGFAVEASAAAMAEVVAEVLADTATPLTVSIMLKAPGLVSPLHHLAFYEEFARRVPVLAGHAVTADPAVEPEVAAPAVRSDVVELERERQSLERQLVELRRAHAGTAAEGRVREAIERNTDARLAAAAHDREVRARPARVFVSYAREDEHLRRRLADHLGGLRPTQIEDWYDGQIVPGQPWAQEIGERMETAEIVLLLVTAAFLGSDFIRRVELATALERHRRGEARVIPVIMKPVYWQGTDLGPLQALPQHAKAVSTWDDQDAALADVARGVSRTAREIAAARVEPAATPTRSRSRSTG